MLEAPKSLTAVIHVRFNYKESEAKPVSEGETQILSRILDQASELSTDKQELLVKFADYINQLGKKDEQSPS